MLWKKPTGMSYCDMCIWIDKSGVIPRIAEEKGKYPKDEDLVYNYLWLLTKMLAIKKHMFVNFSDYDGFAFHAASFYYFQLIKNWNNRGKSVKGRIIGPIVNILDYVKGTLHNRRVEYQDQSFRQVLSEEMNDNNFDPFQFKQQLLSDARAQNYSKTITTITESIKQCDYLIDELLKTTPFRKDSSDWRNIKISILLNTRNILEKRNKLVPLQQGVSVTLWHLPKSLSEYVRVLINEFFIKLKKLILDCFEMDRVDESILTKMISNPEGTYEEELD